MINVDNFSLAVILTLDPANGVRDLSSPFGTKNLSRLCPGQVPAHPWKPHISFEKLPLAEDMGLEPTTLSGN